MTDPQGTIYDVANFYDSAILDRRDYDSYGILRSESSVGYSAASLTGFTPTLPGYTGYQRDSVTGLDYASARWYDPRNGRFINQDPSKFASGDANLYRYVENSPLTHTDPTGLYAQQNNPTGGNYSSFSGFSGSLSISEHAAFGFGSASPSYFSNSGYSSSNINVSNATNFSIPTYSTISGGGTLYDLGSSSSLIQSNNFSNYALGSWTQSAISGNYGTIDKAYSQSTSLSLQLLGQDSYLAASNNSSSFDRFATAIHDIAAPIDRALDFHLAESIRSGANRLAEYDYKRNNPIGAQVDLYSLYAVSGVVDIFEGAARYLFPPTNGGTGPRSGGGGMIRGGPVQVWLATAPVDLRKSFDGLAEHVRVFLGHDPLCGSMFVFRNKNAQRAKILWWDKDGLAIYYKRLERGRAITESCG